MSPSQSILVVDDNPDLLELQRTVLERDGFEVLTAQSGKEALEVLLNHPKVKLILLDVFMSDMTGPELLEHLEKESPELIAEIPVVFLTGADTVPLSRAIGHIRKPIGVTQFLTLVRSYIKQAYH